MNIETASQIIESDKHKIADKMRALFYLRNIKTPESVKAIMKGFGGKSVLLRHELAYVLGQMRMDDSIETLINVLNDEAEDEIVRHEAGEALGNYEYSADIVDALRSHLDSPIKPVSETCYIALKRIEEGGIYISPFKSRDPALPFPDTMPIDAVKTIYLDSRECMYRRYKAMFTLRNLGNEDAIKTLGLGMNDDSALFKHEVSFVFGQMGDKRAVEYLIPTMDKETEHGMVRHESAEALGIIGDDLCMKALMKHVNSSCDILRESVEVALDLHKFINSEEKEYCLVK